MPGAPAKLEKFQLAGDVLILSDSTGAVSRLAHY
jgi:hypothetical protein